MRCQTADRLMSLQLDGLITPDDARELAAHLAHCARCAESWAAMCQADSLLHRPDWPAHSPDLAGRVLAQLPRQRRDLLPLAPVWTRASWVATAAVLLVAAGVMTLLVLVGATLGAREWALVQRSGTSLLQTLWGSLQQLWEAGRHVGSALWQALGWPWIVLLGLGTVMLVTLWVWLWRRSRPAPRRVRRS